MKYTERKILQCILPFNEVPFMTNELKKINHKKNKTTMKRSRLKNDFLKDKNEINRKNCNVQRNYCKKPLKTTQEQYFNALNYF